MEDFAFSQLKPDLLQNNDVESSPVIRAKISTYLSKLHIQLESKEISNDDLSNIIEQLDLFIDHFVSTFKEVVEIHHLSSKLNTLFAKVYTLVLSLMLKNAHDKFNIRLIDVTNKMVNLLTETKKLSIKTNWYSSIKHMALAVLQAIFAQFGGFLNSFKNPVLTTVYKYVSKCHDNYNTAIESSIFKANYFTDLVLLADIMLTNDNSTNTLDDKLFTRLTKLTKYVTHKKSPQSFTYPVLSVTYAYNILIQLLKSDRFVLSVLGRKSVPSVTTYITAISTYLTDIIESMVTEHSQLRLSLAKNVSDLLAFNVVVFGLNLGEEDKSFEYSVNFIMVAYTNDNYDNKVRDGLMMALIQLMTKMNLYYSTNSVSTGHKSGVNYTSLKFFDLLNIVYYHLFGQGTATNQLRPAKDADFFKIGNSSTPSESIFNQIDTCYSLLSRDIDSDINRLIILGKIVYGDSTESKAIKFPSLVESVSAKDQDASNQYYVLSLLNLAQLLIEQLDQYVLSQVDGISESHDGFASQLCNTLFELCKHKNFKIRVSAVDTISKLVTIKPELSFDLLNDSLSTLLSSFEEGKGDQNFMFNESHGLAFLIASTLSSCPKEHINADFVLQIFSVASNFLKKFNSTVIMGNLFGTGSGSYVSNVNYEKQLVSWIILMGLFNYATEKDGSSGSNFFLLESSQFITIWKNLLTHSMPSDFVQTAFVDGVAKVTNLNEIMKLVEIKNHSLVCLLSYINYLSSTKSSVEGSSRSSLLTPEIASSLSQIINKSFAFISNLKLQVSSIPLPSILETTIKFHILRVYQNHIKLAPFLPRNDSNSGLMIDLLDNFCNSGLATYKSNTFKVDELLIKSTSLRRLKPIAQFQTIDELPLQSLYTIESSKVKSHLVPWTDFRFNPLHSSTFSNDYLMYLFNGSTDFGYTDQLRSPPSVEVMITDLSIEIFAVSFGYLSPKIQISVLETLQEAVFPKSGSGKILTALNAGVALHSALSYMHNHNETARQSGTISVLRLTNSVSTMLIDILQKLYAEHSYLSKLAALNSGAIGFVCSLSESKESLLTDQIAITIKSIVENTDPEARSFNILLLSKIAEYSALMNISNIFTVLTTLVVDPHPLVHASSLDALSSVIASQSQVELIGPLLTRVLGVIEHVIDSDEFGFKSTVTVTSNTNYKPEQNSVVILARLVRTLVNNAGPTISFWEPAQKQKLVNVLFALMYLENTSPEAVTRELLKALEELFIFDKSLIPLERYTYFVKFVITNNIKLGVSSGHYVDSEESREIYPVTSSNVNWQLALESYNQMLKLGCKMDTEMEQLLWIALEYSDSTTAKELFENLLDYASTQDRVVWFEKLIKLFNVNKHVLYEPLLSKYRKRIANNGMFFNPLRFRKPALAKSKSNTPTPAPAAKSEQSDFEMEDEGEKFADADDESPVKHESTLDSAKQDPAKPAYSETVTVQTMVLDNEPTNWRFKLYIMQLLTKLVEYARTDARLEKYVSTKVSELVEIAFVCSTSSLIKLRVSSLKLIGDIIDMYGNMTDPVYPEVSLLGQQSAQITTAIVPAFSRDSNIELACTAVVLASKLLSSNIGQVSRMNRIVNVLTTSLEEFANAKGSNIESAVGSRNTLKIGEVAVLTKKSQNKLLVYILQAWSRIKVNCPHENSETRRLLDKYIGILTPLWLYSLRDFAMMKYGSSFLVVNADDVDIQTYEECWVDFVEAIGVIAHEDQAQLNELLHGDGANFFLVLFGQCVEHLIKISSRMRNTVSAYEFRVLDALIGILKLKPALELVFEDHVFAEFIDLLDRLILTADPAFKIKIVELASNVFESYFTTSSGSKSSEELHDDVDKLFELLRINMLAIIQILPFIRDRDLAKVPLKPVEGLDLVLLKKAFDASLNMIAFLPDVIQLDFYTCFLYSFTLIYEFNNTDIIAILLPTLKKTMTGITQVDPQNASLSQFFHSIKNRLDVSQKNSILTVSILITTINELPLTTEEAKWVSEFIVHGLVSEEPSLNAISTQTIKSLIKHNEVHGLLLENFIPKLVELLYSSQLKDPRLAIETLVALTKAVSKDKVNGCLKIIVPIIIWFDEFTSHSYESYLHQKLLDLLRFAPASFKSFVDTCTDEQKLVLERLVKLNAAVGNEPEVVAQELSHIKLKTFGE
ncbi:hypothetical protein OGAPHI_006893 [Ogataea philodendri]|uniref:LAA1-like C-terminal TPR repeats domain-containing protein n=1 Tax=Ogataea philodendri TaxID=1378263 RepID=A0A9P8NVS8_9ASCO|nr:uncharacterized protein OGAPHI_006893 [Ogataea philodendri]KAH3660307.1 hypothetical protein OGAPHI_006893 [Ogataea philodendri]